MILATEGIDQVSLNFSQTSLTALNLVIAAIMFGIALDTKVDDFKAVAKMPKAMAVGIAAQFIALPAITFCLTLLLQPAPSMALGMILVACCPPGNISNLLVYRSKGNVALSVSMTAVANLMAIVLMPINLALWGGLHPEASKILHDFDISALKMLADIVFMIGVPFAIGLTISDRRPVFAARAQPWVRRFSLIAMVIFIVVALAGNLAASIDYIGVVLLVVFLHDTLSLSLGYGLATACGLSEYNRRAVTFEVGVRNAGLGLGIVFSFFDGLGGMAIVAGWWGIWDIVAGLVLSTWWARRPAGRPEPLPEGESP